MADTTPLCRSDYHTDTGTEPRPTHWWSRVIHCGLPRHGRDTDHAEIDHLGEVMHTWPWAPPPPPRTWAPDLITLIADTIEAHQHSLRSTGEWIAELACTCGGWSTRHSLPAWEEFRRHRAGAVVAALTQAGHMLPPGGETERKWVVTYDDGCPWADADDEEHARELHAQCVAEDMWRGPIEVKTYTVTRWPDGRRHVSPWQEVSGQ